MGQGGGLEEDPRGMSVGGGKNACSALGDDSLAQLIDEMDPSGTGWSVNGRYRIGRSLVAVCGPSTTT